MDFTTDLPLFREFNAIFTLTNSLTKTVHLQLCFVGEGWLTTKDVAWLLFVHMGYLKPYCTILTCGSQVIFGIAYGILWA